MADLRERAPIQSTTGIDRDSVPWRLWEKAKQQFWDPSDIDFSKDAQDWNDFTDEQRIRVAGSARGFMVGEEAVTIDILPLVRAISAEGRLEETIFLTSFALEEAKHVDFFRSWFDAVGFDPRTLPSQQPGQNGQQRGGLFDGGLGAIMGRLDTDRSPEAYLDAALTYNQFVEAVLAIAGYRSWNRLFKTLGEDKLPGFQKGLGLVQADERRHIAYGTYLIRRVLAEHPDKWAYVERRWDELTGGILAMRQAIAAQQAQNGGEGNGGGYGGTLDTEFIVKQIGRRLDVLRPTGASAAQVEHTATEEFEPVEMDELQPA